MTDNESQQKAMELARAVWLVDDLRLPITKRFEHFFEIVNLPELLRKASERDEFERHIEGLSQANAEQAMRLAALSQPEKQIKDWIFNANALQDDNTKLRAELDRVKGELEQRDNQIDEQWLNAIARCWMEYCSKPWFTKDGECAEEGRQANIAAVFAEIQKLRTHNALLLNVAMAASNSPCRHSSDHKGDNCPTCNALTAAKDGGAIE